MTSIPAGESNAPRFSFSVLMSWATLRPPMAHIHFRIDFTVAILVVQDGRVLLVHHRNLGRWLPLGGHIELDEDPESAALREAREESGLDVELMGERPPTTGPGTRALIAPRFLDIHRITDTHEHIGMIYWARPKGGKVTLSAAEHHEIRWCSPADLDRLDPPIDEAVRWYCLKAIEEIRDQTTAATGVVATGGAPRRSPIQ